MARENRAAVASAQKLMAQDVPWLQVDGQWGKTTERVFRSLPLEKRNQIALMMGRNYMTSPEQEKQAREFARLQEWITVLDAEQLVAKAAKLYGVERYTVAFCHFLRREAVFSAGRYLVTSRNGSSAGLMQMQPGAWRDAMKVGNKKVPGSIGSFAENVYNAEQNIRAGIAYATLNISILERVHVAVNDETLYLAHNQGAGFFTKGIVTNYSGQSKEVQRMIDKYRR